uniref:Uncharacterized protein n=1 Tax=Coccidioides posadasii RMSCC 3488 TaxID=454284 RepID=A0A0J6F427_COCPO|nr:hypothetical protein CPAG_03984 [Coccidioides posadasii RMSCC 3488]
MSHIHRAVSFWARRTEAWSYGFLHTFRTLRVSSLTAWVLKIASREGMRYPHKKNSLISLNYFPLSRSIKCSRLLIRARKNTSRPYQQATSSSPISSSF